MLTTIFGFFTFTACSFYHGHNYFRFHHVYSLFFLSCSQLFSVSSRLQPVLLSCSQLFSVSSRLQPVLFIMLTTIFGFITFTACSFYHAHNYFRFHHVYSLFCLSCSQLFSVSSRLQPVLFIMLTIIFSFITFTACSFYHAHNYFRFHQVYSLFCLSCSQLFSVSSRLQPVLFIMFTTIFGFITFTACSFYHAYNYFRLHYVYSLFFLSCSPSFFCFLTFIACSFYYAHNHFRFHHVYSLFFLSCSQLFSVSSRLQPVLFIMLTTIFSFITFTACSFYHAHNYFRFHHVYSLFFLSCSQLFSVSSRLQPVLFIMLTTIFGFITFTACSFYHAHNHFRFHHVYSLFFLSCSQLFSVSSSLQLLLCIMLTTIFGFITFTACSFYHAHNYFRFHHVYSLFFLSCSQLFSVSSSLQLLLCIMLTTIFGFLTFTACSFYHAHNYFRFHHVYSLFFLSCSHLVLFQRKFFNMFTFSFFLMCSHPALVSSYLHHFVEFHKGLIQYWFYHHVYSLF